jgi:hypothetical protein
MISNPESSAVACSLGHGELRPRAARWQALAARALLNVSHTERGLRLVFAADPGVAGELQELAALERDCCAFATWSVGTASGQLTLDVTARSEEAVTAVQAMFAALR